MYLLFITRFISSATNYWFIDSLNQTIQIYSSTILFISNLFSNMNILNAKFRYLLIQFNYFALFRITISSYLNHFILKYIYYVIRIFLILIIIIFIFSDQTSPIMITKWIYPYILINIISLTMIIIIIIIGNFFLIILNMNFIIYFILDFDILSLINIVIFTVTYIVIVIVIIVVIVGITFQNFIFNWAQII